MKKLVLTLAAILTCIVMKAEEKITVTVAYNGATATVSIPDGAEKYVTCSSGTDSHVQIEQLLTKDNNPNEIEVTYALSGESEDGGFYMKGEYKCTISLEGVTLTNPIGPAINIENGKRIKVAAKEKTVNTLADGSDGKWKACLYGTGHFEFVQKGTLNVTGNTAHAISCKEYMQFKNQTLNINGAKKDGIHCKQYFWMQKAGKITITGAKDDGIQVELDGKTSTGILPDHEDTEADIDEDTGNCYLDDGTLSIKDFGNSAIKTDGQVIINGGTQDYDANAVSENNNPATAITTLRHDDTRRNDTNSEVIYDLTGRLLKDMRKGKIVIVKDGNEIRKVIIK